MVVLKYYLQMVHTAVYQDHVPRIISLLEIRKLIEIRNND